MLSLLLAVDDFFLLHERYVYQKGIFLFYAVFALTLLVRRYRTILAIDAFPFLLAGFLLAASVEIDINQRKFPFDYIYVQIVEVGLQVRRRGHLAVFLRARRGVSRNRLNASRRRADSRYVPVILPPGPGRIDEYQRGRSAASVSRAMSCPRRITQRIRS